jgi:glucokinase
MPARAPSLVFDIGGTNVRGAICDPATGAVLRATREETPNFLTHKDEDAEQLVEGVFEAMRSVGRTLLDGASPSAVVVGWPGPVSPEGVVLRSPTILGPALDGPIDVLAAARRLWPRSRLAVVNDLTSAGYAYVGLGYRDFCIVTVGSGIGNKVFVGGRAVVGPAGRGGEIGHLLAHLPAGCPKGVVPPGTRLGEVGSGRGTLDLARRLAKLRRELFRTSMLRAEGSRFAGHSLVTAFHAGDVFARTAVALASAPLGHALAAVHVAVGSERFVLTGGFATALGEPYRQLLVQHARVCAWDIGQDWDAMIEIGDERDGLIGAGVLAARELADAAVGVAA